MHRTYHRARPGLERLEQRELLDASASLGFVTKVYQDFLHRSPDSSGLPLYTSALDNGSVTRAQIALDFLASPEAEGLQLGALYQRLLNRAIDPSGLTAFSTFLSSGGTIEQVAALVTGSGEYFQTRASSNNNFLNDLYQDLLGRAIDPTGQAVFSQQLSQGVSRLQVAEAILSSSEYVTQDVQNLYQDFLHRAADPGGLQFFVSAMQMGAPSQLVVADLVSSNEYYAGADPISAPNLTPTQVQQLLNRASAASNRNDAIIAVVDRNGTPLGIRVEAGVDTGIQTNPVLLTFAVDGALAEARTGAFFGNGGAPLTSRTIQFISQSTITQREVDSNPDSGDPNSPLYGPGLVAPVGLGGHFPPKINDTPSADLFNIEATNRDSIVHAGADGNKSPTDYIQLPSEFNVPTQFIPSGQATAAPESYGLISGIDPFAQARGLGTLPGGIPIYENGSVVVGGIGVFFPGTTGFATAENSSLSATYNPNLPDLSLVAEYMAFAAVGGSAAAGFSIGAVAGQPPVSGVSSEPYGVITLVGITLPLFGPGVGSSAVQALVQFGSSLGTRGPMAYTDLAVDLGGDQYLGGQSVPSGWLVTPHAGVGGLTAADIVQIVQQGLAQAVQTRAAIRLPSDGPAQFVFAVSDLNGNILGLYREPDATIFSIDVAVAKSRNTAYYANPSQLQPQDQVAGVPAGAGISSRSFRYLALPDFPEGIDGTPPGPFSVLNDPGTNPANGLNTGAPVPASAITSVMGYDTFHPGTNFHDPVNPGNQNGIVFFPGGVPLYKTINGVPVLVGGLGISGDGVDQDDVVTFVASQGFTAPANLTADNFFVRGVRLPYQKFNRNPDG
jgi:uncharacterized protein GlcG (DUF336 family)